jgi:hypothetical protein
MINSNISSYCQMLCMALSSVPIFFHPINNKLPRRKQRGTLLRGMS